MALSRPPSHLTPAAHATPGRVLGVHACRTVHGARARHPAAAGLNRLRPGASARLAQSKERRRERAPPGLVLVPTRELAEQVAGVLGPFGRKVGVRTITVYGGVSIGRQIEQARGADLVVATPGRLIDLMERGAC